MAVSEARNTTPDFELRAAGGEGAAQAEHEDRREIEQASADTGKGYLADLKGAMPARASSSARSFSGCPAWPLTHSQVT